MSAAVAKLKNQKAAGPDGLMAEHLKEGGESVANEYSKCCGGVGGCS